jgi:hypothetical protein
MRLPEESNWIDYRRGLDYAIGRRNSQPRGDGPPLLFKTDVRASILCMLALAGRPMRFSEIRASVQKSCVYALRELTRSGLVKRAAFAKNVVYFDLDHSHPAASELRSLYLRLAEVYSMPRPCFDATLPPVVLSASRVNSRDLAATFGAPVRTLPLLFVFIRGSANGDQIYRCMPFGDRKFTLRVLRMFRTFGVLESKRVSRGIQYSLSERCPIVNELTGVLRALDRAMPQWRAIIERDISAPKFRRESRVGHRRNKRWKW